MNENYSPGVFSRMLGWISPKWALRREMARLGLRNFYAAAKQNRTTEGWTSVTAGAETTNRASRDVIRARARDLERNSDVMGGLIHPMTSNITGIGFQLQCKVLAEDGAENDAFNTKVEALWRQWCRPQNCDIRQLRSFAEILELIVRRRFVDGGILVLKITENDSFRLQVLEVDRLDTSIASYTEAGSQISRRVEGGIEVDEYSRPVAYHIRGNTDLPETQSRRVLSKDVIYLPVLTRAEQVREVSPLSSSLSRIDDINEFISSALMKERVLSYLGVFVENSQPGGGFGRGFGLPAEPKKSQELSLEQGMITYLAPGEKVQTISPAGVSSTAGEMLRTTQRLTGSGQGLSYEAASRDMSQVNYSSARQGMLDDRKTYGSWQTYLIDHFLTPIYEEWLDWMIFSKRLKLPHGVLSPEEYRRHVWIRPGWDWIDPLKEANANRVALETYQTTLQEICASKGRDWRDVLAQRKVELDAIQEGGELHCNDIFSPKVDLGKLGGAEGAQTSPGQPVGG